MGFVLHAFTRGKMWNYCIYMSVCLNDCLQIYKMSVSWKAPFRKSRPTIAFFPKACVISKRSPYITCNVNNLTVRGTFHLYELTIILAWARKYIRYNMLDEIIYPFPKSQ